MEKVAKGQPLRRPLMCGVPQSLPAAEDNAEDGYFPLGASWHALLAQAMSAHDNYNANHDAGDFSIEASPWATQDDGCDAGGGVWANSAQGTSHTALQSARANGPGAAPTPSALSKPPPTSSRRQPKAAAKSAAEATRPRNPT